MLLLGQAHPDLTHRQALRLCCVPRGYIHANFSAQSPDADPKLVLNLALIPAEAMGTTGAQRYFNVILDSWESWKPLHRSGT